MIGNSHISAFVLGWKEIRSDYPSLELEFFGAPGGRMRRLEVSNGSLVPGSSELKHYFALTSEKRQIDSDYDFYLICGLRLGLLHMEELFESYRAENFRRDERTPLSNKCFARSLEGCVLATAAADTTVKLREITAAPIVVIPDPLPTPNYTECDFINRAERRGDDELVAGFFDAACTSACGTLDARCFFQPRSTKSSFLRTSEEYSHGAMQLRGGFEVAHQDLQAIAKHMNPSYGSVMLRELFGSLAAG